MAQHGVEIVPGQGMSRVQLSCTHQKGLLYVVPAEKSWVCSQEDMPAHALAGFLGELVEQQDPSVKELMNRWGIYFRRLPLEDNEGANAPTD